MKIRNQYRTSPDRQRVWGRNLAPFGGITPLIALVFEKIGQRWGQEQFGSHGRHLPAVVLNPRRRLLTWIPVEFDGKNRSASFAQRVSCDH
jgi:hypothetical protein